jgi:hypothetical protein
MRRMVLTTLCIGVPGVLAELLLLGHTESWQQWIPVTGLLIGLGAIVLVVRRPSANSLRAFRWLMIVWIASGALGIFYHIRGNLEFELERVQSLEGLPLAWNAMTGATPILGPGAMVLLALIGLIYLHRQPATSDTNERHHD